MGVQWGNFEHFNSRMLPHLTYKYHYMISLLSFDDRGCVLRKINSLMEFIDMKKY